MPVGKWTLGLLLVLLSCLPIFLNRSSGPNLLQDTDTRVLLETIRQRNDPVSWFTGDWPLGNHFYRPVSTLSFEMDQRLWGSNPAGYGLTNALLCMLCVVSLFWFLRELTGRFEIAVPGAILFALWHLGFSNWLATIVHWLSIAALASILLPGRSWKNALLAFLTLLFLSAETVGKVPLGPRMIDWLPGRTASVMTLFVLLALASYARYERTSASRVSAPDPGPLDPPATKGTEVGRQSTFAVAWVLIALLSLALALASYEQAVMAPALLFGVAVCMRLQRYKVRWTWQIFFWGVLLGYLILRSRLVPTDVSGYQAQQFRSGPGVWSSILDYLLPGAMPLWFGFVSYDVRMMIAEGGVAGLLMSFPYQGVISFGSTVGAFIAARKEWLLPLTGWAVSTLAFLPMAWLKHFDHYHYLPMAMRALFVAAMAVVAGKVFVSAVSRPALQAPPRLDPAPGSLPRP